ncbi:hypothetical protein [Novosphingobium sp. JCM 18896]|uniref:hypothetical protein n=1 Tax=Novosphingobium sp. JCM 18896 TaxID=2989731 RepID=UPI002221DCF1|nr:hypothetical protein [Novosphingobium sp. JCM 18896]MCW1430365.1 hypothetical protein [Novosphingobium sp. JCM 18896]
MERHGDEIHINTEDARGGSTPNIVRYVLLISLLLVIVALSAVWMTGAMNAPQDRPGDGITNQAPPTSN